MASTTTGQSRREQALREVAFDSSASPEERARAVTALGRSVGNISPDLAQIRRQAIAALHHEWRLSLSEIARRIGLSVRGGRVCRILAAHRARTEEATDGTA